MILAHRGLKDGWDGEEHRLHAQLFRMLSTLQATVARNLPGFRHVSWMWRSARKHVACRESTLLLHVAGGVPVFMFSATKSFPAIQQKRSHMSTLCWLLLRVRCCATPVKNIINQSVSGGIRHVTRRLANLTRPSPSSIGVGKCSVDWPWRCRGIFYKLLVAVSHYSRTLRVSVEDVDDLLMQRCPG